MLGAKINNIFVIIIGDVPTTNKDIEDSTF